MFHLVFVEVTSKTIAASEARTHLTVFHTIKSLCKDMPLYFSGRDELELQLNVTACNHVRTESMSPLKSIIL